MLVIRAGIHNIIARIANREDPDLTASDLGLPCLSKSFWQILEHLPYIRNIFLCFGSYMVSKRHI